MGEEGFGNWASETGARIGNRAQESETGHRKLAKESETGHRKLDQESETEQKPSFGNCSGNGKLGIGNSIIGHWILEIWAVVQRTRFPSP